MVNTLYLLEERPAGDNWKNNADFLGNFEKFTSSDKSGVKNLCKRDNSNSVDQAAFVKARLFDFYNW